MKPTDESLKAKHLKEQELLMQYILEVIDNGFDHLSVLPMPKPVSNLEQTTSYCNDDAQCISAEDISKYLSCHLPHELEETAVSNMSEARDQMTKSEASHHSGNSSATPSSNKVLGFVQNNIENLTVSSKPSEKSSPSSKERKISELEALEALGINVENHLTCDIELESPQKLLRLKKQHQKDKEDFIRYAEHVLKTGEDMRVHDRNN